MKKIDRSALVAVASILAHPLRALFAPARPTLTLTAPIVPATPRAITGGLIRADVTSDPKAMVAALQAAFNEFKATNDTAVGAKADDGHSGDVQ